MTRVGYLTGYAQVQEMAEEIRKLRVTKINETDVQHVIYDTIGKRWVRRYLNRHPELVGLTAKAIEAAQVKEVTQKGMMMWFNNLANTIEEFKITPENMYNMDESGFSIGTIEASHVIINASVCQKFQAQLGHQEWVISVECICTDRTALD